MNWCPITFFGNNYSSIFWINFILVIQDELVVELDPICERRSFPDECVIIRCVKKVLRTLLSSPDKNFPRNFFNESYQNMQRETLYNFHKTVFCSRFCFPNEQNLERLNFKLKKHDVFFV